MFRAVGSPNVAFIITCITQIILVVVSYLFSHFTPLGLWGVWWAAPITHIMGVGIAYYWYRRGTWQKSLVTYIDTQKAHATEEILIEEGVRST